MNWNEADKLVSTIPYLCIASQGKILFEEAQKLEDGAQILEIGAWKGYSTCALALACIGTQKRVWTIDTFRGNPKNTNEQDGELYIDEFWANVTRLGVDSYVTALVGKSEEFYESWKRPIDLLFIDGNHLIMQADYDAFYPHLKVGGMLLMHDVYPSDKRDFLHGMTFSYNLGYRMKK